MLRLRLRRGFELYEDDREISGNFRSQKAKALFVYLVLADNQPIARRELQTLLWGDFTHKSAQANLRVTLSNLRHVFNHIAGLLTIDRETVYLNQSHNDFWCDLLDDEAVSLTQPLLPELHNLGSEPFQNWLEEIEKRYLHSAESRPHTNIGRARTPLFGRDDDIAQIRTRILQRDTPLITICGVGGGGKTRLALAVGRSLLDKFKHGVWFIPLASLSPRDDGVATVATEILTQLQVNHHAPRNPQEQLITYLQSRSLLLILDNVEQLLHSPFFAAFLVDLLLRASKVQVLLTSRKRLAIPAERGYELQKLPTPSHDTVVQSLRQSPSVQLFVEKAQRVSPNFILTKQNGQAVAEICRLVDGIPLGIELAATQIVRHRSAEIAAMLADSLTTIHSDDLKTRHTNLAVVFEHSWRLLTPELQQMLTACALFRGDFSLQSALAVTGGNAEQLFHLVQHSLVQQIAPARIALHPIIGEFVTEKLRLSVRRDELERVFATHYLAILAEQSLPLLKLATRTPVQIVTRELNHIRLAWRLAVQQQNFSALANAVDALHLLFSRYVGQYPACIDLLAAADRPIAPQSLRHSIGIWMAHLLALSGESEAGIERVRAVTQVASEPLLLARAYNIWGLLQSFDEEFESTEILLAKAWQHAQNPHEPALHHERIAILIQQAFVYIQLGKQQHADELTSQALAQTQAGGYVYWEMALLYDQARADVYQYRYDRAITTLLPLIEQGEQRQLVQSVVTLLAALCHCHLELGQAQKALATIQRARDMLAESTLGMWYTLFIGRYTSDCLLQLHDLEPAQQLSDQLCERVEGEDDTFCDMAFLNALHVQLATADIAAARATFCKIDATTLAPAHTLDYYDIAVQLGIATNTLQLPTVDALIEAVATPANTLYSLRVYQTIVAGLSHLDDPRTNRYRQIAHDARVMRAANITDPQLRQHYLSHQKAAYPVP